MKRLILDHFRRWWWVLALAGVVEFAIGVSTSGRSAENTFDLASTFQFQVALFTGTFLLGFDFQRGLARTVSALPLTSKQIGRAWWLATVGIPAVVLTALLILGAETFHLFHPDKALPFGRLALSSLVTLLWLGIGFTIIFSTSRGWYGNWWERARNVFFGITWGLMIGSGFWFLKDVLKDPVKFGCFLGVGTALTAFGWFRAEQFVMGRASFRIAGLQSNDPRGQHRAPVGFGGIPYLISTTFIRSFLIGLAMFIMMPVFLALQGNMKSLQRFMESTAGMGNTMPFWLIIIFSTMPALLQLRFLRTLPVSATKLTAVMIGLVLLPLIALGAVVAGISGIFSGPTAAITVLKSYSLMLAPAALCVVFVGWLGAGRDAFALMLFTMILFQVVPLWIQVFFNNREIPFSLVSVIVGVTVTLAFLFMRYSLLHSSKTYRVHANPFGTAWGAGR